MNLVLGTTQFGLDYGIANKVGKVSRKSVFEILEYAYTQGIRGLDTAYSYGESEKVIGDFIAKSGKDFEIVSKVSRFITNDGLSVRQSFSDSSTRLGKADIYAYLIHDFNRFINKKEEIWDEMVALKDEGLVKKIGFSLYKPEELTFLLDEGLALDIVQVPYSVFDQRFVDYFPSLKDKGIEINVRSVFLQGLFFLSKSKIDSSFKEAKINLGKLWNLAKSNEIPVSSLCLCFVLLNTLIDKVVIGVDSLDQLRHNIEAVKYMDKVKSLFDLLADLKLHRDDIVLPYKWVCS